LSIDWTVSFALQAMEPIPQTIAMMSTGLDKSGPHPPTRPD
jgi:hypothetical protein